MKNSIKNSDLQDDKEICSQIIRKKEYYVIINQRSMESRYMYMCIDVQSKTISSYGLVNIMQSCNSNHIYSFKMQFQVNFMQKLILLCSVFHILFLLLRRIIKAEHMIIIQHEHRNVGYQERSFLSMEIFFPVLLT